MEVVSGLITLRHIFLDNDNWQKFLEANHGRVRPAILTEVMKMLTCCTDEMGFHTYSCPICDYTKNVPHSCKSKFCSPCGKKAADNWRSKNYNIMPKTIWQHITFTIPDSIIADFVEEAPLNQSTLANATKSLNDIVDNSAID